MKRIIKALSIIVLSLFAFIALVGCEVKVDDGGGQNQGQNGEDPSNNQNQGDNGQGQSGGDSGGNQNQGDNGQGGNNNQNDEPGEEIDFAGTVKLDMTSNTIKQEVTVKTYVDGDTTHFNVPESFLETGVIKARYLGINTPESTGKIEEYGKAASKFTKAKLESATSIIIESDDDQLNADSTGGRYLLWIWYRTADDQDYRNLNIEILQNGLAIASNSANNRYGEYCVNAINQAKALKLNIYSGKQDPDFYYGEAVELTLKELRCNIEQYNGVKVAFEGVVVKDYSQTVYVEEYDEELDMYFGMTVYYGFSAAADVLNILSVGNRVRVVGSVQYYETGGSYQVSGLTYRAMRPKDPGNVQKISEGHLPSYNLVDAETFAGKVTVDFVGEDDEITQKEFDYAALAMSSSISMNNLVVKSVYTTNNPDSSSNGAMTITCEVNGITISVRTVVLRDGDDLITEDAFLGKTINVRGIVDVFDGKYQIKLYSMNDVTVVE